MTTTQDDIELRQRRNLPGASRTFPLSQQLSPLMVLTPPIDGDQVSPWPRPSVETEGDALSSRPLLYGRGSSDQDSQSHDNERLLRLQDSGDLMANLPLTGSGSHAGDRLKKPKHITRATWTRYFNGWLVHMPALLTTLAILCIGSKKIYWYPEQGPFLANKYRVKAEIIGNVLQLAAKVHELLIVASLSSISLAMFRRRLITKGVRLGFLTGSYRVGDLNYLGTAAFWRQGLNLLEPWEVLLSGFLVFATIMSTIVGPASAVLLLPTLDWFEFKPGTAFENIQPPLIYWWDRDRVWNRDYMKTDRLQGCESVDGIYLARCPAGGFMQISNWVQNYGATDLRNNLTFPATSADVRRQVLFVQANSQQIASSATLCTTAPQFLLDTIGLFQQYIKNARDGPVGAVSHEPRYRLIADAAVDANSSPVGLYQPFVQSRCTVHNKDHVLDNPQGEEVFYPLEDLKCFGDKECLDHSGAWKPRPLNKTNFAIIDKTYQNPSIETEFRASKDNSSLIYLSGLIPNTESGKPSNVLYLCSMTANWVRTSFSTDQSVSDILHSEFSNGDSMRELYDNQSARNTLPIRFFDSWFEYLNPKWNTPDLTGVSPLWLIVQGFSRREQKNGTTLRYMATGNNNTAMEVFLGKVFGGYLTEALARSSFGADARIKLNKTGSELNFVNLDEQYGFRGGIHRIIPKLPDKPTEKGVWDEWRNKTSLLQNTSFPESFEEYNNFFLDTALPIDVHAERYGYGTGQKRRTLLFAQAMLCIYLGSVATYAGAVLIGHVLEFFKVKLGRRPVRVLSVIPWSDLQELFILGLKSPPPVGDELVDAGAGVTCTGVWEKVVKAGADDELNVRLVFEGTPIRRLDDTGAKRYF